MMNTNRTCYHFDVLSEASKDKQITAVTMDLDFSVRKVCPEIEQMNP